MTHDQIRKYLETCIEHWKTEESHGSSIASYYLDAFQSVYASIFGAIKSPTVTMTVRRGLTAPDCAGWWWTRGKPTPGGQLTWLGDGWPGPAWAFYYLSEEDFSLGQVEISPGDREEPPEYAPFDRFVEFCGPLPDAPPSLDKVR